MLDGWRRRKCGIESTNPTVSLGSGKCNGRFWQSVVVPWANDGRWGNVSSRAAINRRGRAVVLKRTRILDKYSETFMMAGALPGKEKTNTKDNKSRALKYYFFFKNLEATFALFRSPAAEDCGAQTPQSSSSPREFAVLSSDRYRRGVYTGKGKYVMRLSLSLRGSWNVSTRFTSKEEGKKMERTRGFSIFGNRQQTEQTGPSQSSMAQSLTCLQIDPALHCYV